MEGGGIEINGLPHVGDLTESLCADWPLGPPVFSANLLLNSSVEGCILVYAQEDLSKGTPLLKFFLLI